MFISNYKAYILNTKCKLSETSDLCGSPRPMPPVHGGLVTGSSGGGAGISVIMNFCREESSLGMSCSFKQNTKGSVSAFSPFLI